MDPETMAFIAKAVLRGSENILNGSLRCENGEWIVQFRNNRVGPLATALKDREIVTADDLQRAIEELKTNVERATGGSPHG